MAEDIKTEKTRVEAKLGIRPLLALGGEVPMRGAASTYLADFLKSVHGAMTDGETRRVVKNPTIHQDCEDLFVAGDVVVEDEAGSPLDLAWQEFQREYGKKSPKAEEALKELKTAILDQVPGWAGLNAGNFRLTVAVVPGEML